MQFPDLLPLEEHTMAEISYESEGISYALDEKEQERLTEWIHKVAAHENKGIQAITFVFCSDDYLHRMNVEHLQHDTLTDVITFPYSKNPIEGDIFISIDRIEENAATFGVSFEEELRRVMIHGVLHICGYKDKTKKDKALMTQKENEALGLLQP